MEKFSKRPKTEREGYIKPKAHKPPTERKKEKLGDAPERETKHVKRSGDREHNLGFKKGGKVKETGKALVHKGEVVLPKELVNRLKKLL